MEVNHFKNGGSEFPTGLKMAGTGWTSRDSQGKCCGLTKLTKTQMGVSKNRGTQK